MTSTIPSPYASYALYAHKHHAYGYAYEKRVASLKDEMYNRDGIRTCFSGIPWYTGHGL